MDRLESLVAQDPWLGLLVALVGGILAGFTPCTYPMLPITVAFVGSRAGGRRWRGFLLSVFYVFGMAVVYSALGAAAALTGRLFGTLTMNPWVYLFVGNLCLLFALTLLDVIPLRMPAFLSRLQTRSFSGHDLVTSVFMGGVSALVVSPCTTPILGALLTLVATGQNVLWGMGMLFLFAYGMGSLVILVGTFAGLLTSLPRSGPWMARIQKGFALVMILAAEYFFVKAGELWI